MPPEMRKEFLRKGIEDINSVRVLLVYPQEKYDENVDPWGGVSYKGLVPSRSPFVLIPTRIGKILKRNVQELLECNLEPPTDESS